MIKSFRTFHVLVAVIIIVFISSCSNRYKNALFTSPHDYLTDTLKSIVVVNDKGDSEAYYHIKANDLVAIRNLQSLEFAGAQTQSQAAIPVSFTVDSDGNVNLPLIGKVQISGLTRREAADKIQNAFGKELLKNPIIELNVINLKVTVLGEFSSPKNYLLEKENTSLIDIIGEAGGLTNKADVEKIKIIRGDRLRPEIIYVNLKNINSLSSKKLILQNDDIIYAEPRKIYSKAETLQTTMTFIQPALLIINTALIIYNLSR